ncbi:MAG TPA: FAD-dependent monooxygenase [Pilimelia sp.]|nr:FAD-dependent monooxygenase [Pilimelia sp.]
MRGLRVLISGASIAGPALAFWLSRYGCQVTVVERAPAFRPGGQAVDFKGETHRKVLDRMGLWEEICRRQTSKTDLIIVDEHDRRLSMIPGEFAGGDVEILRGDLATLLYEQTASGCEYLFGNSITSLTETRNDVDVTFTEAPPRSFDLVVGADGIHSNVRRLAFGAEEQFVTHLGYYYAVVGTRMEKPEHAKARAQGYMYNTPGRLAVIGGPKAPELFVFASPPLQFDRYNIDEQKQILRQAFIGIGWKVPEMLARLGDAPEFYLDSISRVRMDTYTSGRFALLGDAAYGNTLGGFGTGLAMVGAYVLAGELAAAAGAHEQAFARYNEQMFTYAKVARKGSAGPFLAPATPMKIRMRNWTFNFSPMFRAMMWLTDRFATDIRLRDYANAGRSAPATDG